MTKTPDERNLFIVRVNLCAHVEKCERLSTREYRCQKNVRPAPEIDIVPWDLKNYMHKVVIRLLYLVRGPTVDPLPQRDFRRHRFSTTLLCSTCFSPPLNYQQQFFRSIFNHPFLSIRGKYK